MDREVTKGNVSNLAGETSKIGYLRFSDLINRYNGIGPGFDFIRLSLAVLIFYGHTKFALGGVGKPTILNSTIEWDIGKLGSNIFFDSISNSFSLIKSRFFVIYVPMFFALSGFLVAGSAIRLKDVRSFLVFRALRIFPALTFEVVLSALILGFVFSNLSLVKYFSDYQFYRYFGNILGFITFTLPGVFEDNPLPRIVNLNLWTLPAEFYCYLSFSIAMVLGIPYSKIYTLIITGLAYLVFSIASLFWGIGVSPQLYSIGVVTFYFVVGVVFYVWRDQIPFHRGLFLLSTGLVFLAPHRY